MADDKNNRIGIIEVITSPLGFFALALMIVESFLGLVLTASQIPKELIVYGVCLGTGLFVFITSLVFILTWFKPEHLILDKDTVKHKLSQDDKENQQKIVKFLESGNVDRLNDWKIANNLSANNTFFIYSAEYKDARGKAVRDLNISS